MSVVLQKASYFDKSSQLMVLNGNGTLLESCNTLFDVPIGYNLFENIPFIESLKDVIGSMNTGSELRYGCVHMNIMDREGYYDVVVEKNMTSINFLLYDATDLYKGLIQLQQERNIAAISKELFEAQKKATELEKELLAIQNVELKKRQEFKSEFFAKVSHDIRTPVSTISGLIGLLENEGLVEGNKYFESIKSASSHLLSIVNDVLDLSKIEAGKLELINKEFNVIKLVSGIVHAFEPIAREKNIALRFKNKNTFAENVIGDETRLSQILYNVIGNALKFTNQGSVVVSVSAYSKHDNKTEVYFEVKDTGIGIENEYLKEVLDSYQQVNNGAQGTGLGLSIVKQLVDLYGGKLSIESKKGKGTQVSFSITFNNDISQSEVNFKENEIISSFKKVILIDDDDLNLKVSTLILSNKGFHVKSYNSELDSLSFIDDNEFDVLITDFNIGELNGVEILSYIRNFPNSKSKTPVFVITAGIENKTKELLNDLGVDGIMLKPLDIQELLNHLSKCDLIGQRPQRDTVINVNLDFLNKITDNNPQLLKEAIETFQKNIPDVFDLINNTLDRRDWDGFGKAVHKIKPNFGYLGVQRMVDLMQLAEDESKSGQSYHFCKRIVSVVQTYYSSQITNQLNRLLKNNASSNE